MVEEKTPTGIDENQAPADAPVEQKTFSGAEIKKRLRSKSKNQLISIIVGLASKVDAHEAHKEEINQKVFFVRKIMGIKDSEHKTQST